MGSEAEAGRSIWPEGEGGPALISTMKGNRAKDMQCETESHRRLTGYSIWFSEISEQKV